MLLQLEIKNFAIIEHSIINFEKGFNVLTGETGAGKSILLDALSAILGERTSKEYIRRGEEKAELKAVFAKTPSIENKLREFEMEITDDIIILERQITKNGRSISKINGSIQTTQYMKDVSNCLIEICGQRDHQHLLKETYYLHLIDSLLGEEHEKEVKEYQEVYKKYKEVEEALNSLINKEREKEQLLDLYRFQKQEIEDANIKIGEEEEVENEKKVLASFEKISHSVGRTIQQLDIMEALYQAQRDLSEAARFEEKLGPFSERLEKVSIELEDIKTEIESYYESMEYDEYRLNELMNRLDVYKTIKRKYGDTIEDVLTYYEEISVKLDEIENKEEHMKRLEKEKGELLVSLTEKANALHIKRTNVAKTQGEKINQELKELCMPHSSLRFEVTKTSDFTLHGCSKVQLLFSANKGEDMKPLAKIASGGEMSRVLLAIKIATNVEKEMALVFDEVDEGVGGEVGRIIGEKIAKLGHSVQTIVISHLPQVAAKADSHYLIQKEALEERTVSNVKQLTDEERKQEIARMIYGDEKNEITLKQAEEMLKK